MQRSLVVAGSLQIAVQRDFNSMPMTSHDFTIKLMVFTTLSTSHPILWPGQEFLMKLLLIFFRENSRMTAEPSKGLMAMLHIYYDLHHFSPQRFERFFYEAFTASPRAKKGAKKLFKSSEVEKCHLRLKISGAIKLNKHQMLRCCFISSSLLIPERVKRWKKL